MKTVLLLLCSVLLHHSHATIPRAKRGSLISAYSYSNIGLDYPSSDPFRVSIQESPLLYSLGIDSFLPFANAEYPKSNIAPVAASNSVEKPVQELSDPVPQMPRGTAVIPLTPPPAVPVNAAAANVPAARGAVFLGSGSLGVVHLGNGAFALGSGGIGYSDMRQQPRHSGMSPLFPPLPANPRLLPAATPSQVLTPIPQANLSGQLTSNGVQFSQPFFTSTPSSQAQNDPNGYERLNPNAVGFGMPTSMVRPLKTRMNYATITVPQITVEAAYPNQLPQSGFGDPIPRLPPEALKYV
ncbi:uncharacterized protein [Euwallacea similis]|uniref:uncharacterized protein n=1 Tax=Euwallacea similis TaxID=1736056 RepID=UPI00344FB6F1